MRYIIIVLLLVCNIASAQGKTENNQSQGIQERPKLSFLPGAPKYTGQYYKRHYRKAIKLREFKVGKKYCLWNSENFDDECQDAAMEYAYGPKWREFKKVALDFVEYVNKMDVKNVEKLIIDKRFDYFYGHSIREGKNYLYDAIHYSQGERIKDSDSLKSFSPPNDIDEHRIYYWQKGLKGTEYKNFLLVKPDNFWTYKIDLSKNIIITFRTLDEENTLISFYHKDEYNFWPLERKYTNSKFHLVPKIDWVEHYMYE